MSHWAVRGVQCVCITDFWEIRGMNAPYKLQTLTVREAYRNPVGILCLRFLEVPGWTDPAGNVHGYAAKNFRPLTPVGQDEDVGLFTHHLNKPEAVR